MGSFSFFGLNSAEFLSYVVLPTILAFGLFLLGLFISKRRRKKDEAKRAKEREADQKEIQELKEAINKVGESHKEALLYLDGLPEVRERKKVILLREAFNAMEKYHRGEAIEKFSACLELVADDKKRCALLLLIGWNQHLKGLQKDAKQTYLEAMNIALKYNIEDALRQAFNGIGLLYAALSEFENSEAYLESALEIEKRRGHKFGEAAVLGNMGILYQLMQNPKKALKFLTRAAEINTEINEQKGKAHNLTEMGFVYRRLGKHDKAMQLHLQALQLADDFGDIELRSSNLGGIGNIYFAKEEPEKALEFLDEAYKIAKQIGSLQSQAILSGNIAAAHLMLNNTGTAEKYLDISIEIAEREGYLETQANYWTNRGSLYLVLKDNKNALQCFRKAQELSEKVGDVAKAEICGQNVAALERKVKRDKTNR